MCCSTKGGEPFFLKISIVFSRGRREREGERKHSPPLSLSLSSAPSPPPPFRFLTFLPALSPLPHFPPSLPPLHHTSHRGSRLSLASSHFVTILPNAVFFSGASSASTCAIGECEGSRREDHPSRTRVVTSTAQMWPWSFSIFCLLFVVS